MTANAEIVLEEHPNSLIIPESAITYDAQRNATVEVLDPGAKNGRKKVTIKTGVGNGTKTQVHGRPEGRRQDRPSELRSPVGQGFALPGLTAGSGAAPRTMHGAR